MPQVISISTFKTLVPALILLFVGVSIYSNTSHAPFVFDDMPSIVGNESIRSLWPIWDVFNPPSKTDITVSGRPVLNFTFALNYAISGDHVWSYHALSLLIHITCALLLFGIVRRTLNTTTPESKFSANSSWIAFAIALLWMAHPLTTSAVTYIAQRAESLVAMFLLLTLYTFIRSRRSPRSWRWQVGSVVSCLLGMATKEVMVVAPIIVLLYDRVFLSASFRQILKSHWLYYTAIFSTWLLLLALVVPGPRVYSVNTLDMSPLDYLKIQCGAIVHYLHLSFWPDSLVFDYGRVEAGVALPSRAADYLYPGLLVMGLLVATAVGFRYKPKVAFVAACFFLILAPSSSFMPLIAQPIAEYRMYLPLAAVVTILVLTVVHLARDLTKNLAPSIRSASATTGFFLIFILTIIVGSLTYVRNSDFRSERSIWRDTVEKRPGNPRAHYNLALVMTRNDEIDDRIAHYRESIRLYPNDPRPHTNLAIDLTKRNKFDEAMRHFKIAIELDPHSQITRENLNEAIRIRDLRGSRQEPKDDFRRNH